MSLLSHSPQRSESLPLLSHASTNSPPISPTSPLSPVLPQLTFTYPNPTNNSYVGQPYAWCVLVILMLVGIINFLDRTILAILATDVKAALALSDTQLGFLSSGNFYVPFAIFGIIWAKIADRWIRKNIIIIGLILWSSMTVFSGLSTTFLFLVLVRFGLGIGESTSSPPAYSIIADYFTTKNRGTAFACLAAAVNLGQGIGLFLGGNILDGWNSAYPDSNNAPFKLQGWQATYIIMGIPGFALAIFVCCIQEPVRGQADTEEQSKKPPLIEEDNTDIGKLAHSDSDYDNVLSTHDSTHPFLCCFSRNTFPFQIFFTELLTLLPPFSFYFIYTKSQNSSRHLYYHLGLFLGISLMVSLLSWGTTDIAQWITYGVICFSFFTWLHNFILIDDSIFIHILSKPFIFSMFGIGVWCFPLQGLGFWLPTYFMREYDKTASEIGTRLGLISVIGGALGVILSGFASDFLKKYSPHRIRFIICLVGLCLSLPFIFILFLFPSSNLQVGFFFVFTFSLFGTVCYAQAPGIVADLIPKELRATGTQYYILMTTLGGTACSPYVIGKLSDNYMSSGYSSADSLRFGLLWSCGGFIIAIIFLLLGYHAIAQQIAGNKIEIIQEDVELDR